MVWKKLLSGMKMKLEQELKNKTIIIATHEYATGPSHALENYLSKLAGKLLFIGHPFIFAKDKRSYFKFYKNSILVEKKYFPAFLTNQIVSSIKDAILSIYWVIKKGKFDIYIGVDGLNATIGVLLKKMGLAKKVVFYTIDFVPDRFKNKLLNWLYHLLDKIAVERSDKVWNLSPVMVAEREKRGMNKEFRKKQIVVPVGTESGISRMPFKKIKRYHVGHMGHLIKKQGIQLVIEAIPYIIKQIPNFHFDVIGGGEYEEDLQKLAYKLGVLKYVTFYGFVENHQEVERMLSTCAIGVAPYVNSEDNYVRYTDPGKVKAYLAAGLPVVITKVPLAAYEIEKNECGIAIKYDKTEFAEAIIKLLTNKDLLIKFRKNSLKMAKKYTWNNIFDKAIKETIS